MPPRVSALAGLFLFVFAVLALTGPGRIDIIDGQARYEVARSLWEHGDTQIRDPEVWFPILIGPDGKTYTNYRLPHSALGVAAIAVADLTGPTSEPRRYFYFLMLSAVAGATLAVAYAVWFAGHGCSPRSAILWAAAGIYCTPSWFYSTSTFDDIFGATTVVVALTMAWRSRERGSVGWALLAGLSVGAAFNWKQPLVIFLLPVLCGAGVPPANRQAGRLHHNANTTARQVAILAGAAVGLIVYQGYEWLRFPPGFERPTVKWNPPMWAENPLAAAAALLVSPVCGATWYCPPVVLGFAGLMRSLRTERAWAPSILIACGGYFAFICSLAFFKGNVAWGPRYLTPVFAVLWLFVPAAAAVAGRLRTGILLSLGLVTQLLGLSTDPHRAYIVAGIPPHVLLYENSAYYDWRLSHLVTRPGEIWDVLTNDDDASESSPAPTTMYALPLPDMKLIEPSVARRYHVFADFRPWWCWQRHLDPADRPVDLAAAAALLLAVAAAGITLGLAGAKPSPRSLT